MESGTRREVVDAEGTAFVFECYTLRESAEALGRSSLTLRRWIEQDIIPGMALKDTTFNYGQYTKGELTAIARVLAEHETEYKYIRVEHEDTIDRLHVQVNRYRQKRGIQYGDPA